MKRFFIFSVKALAALLAATVCYAAFMYVYAQRKFTPLRPLTPAYELTSPAAAWQNDILFIHAVNTPERARAKDAHYNGFEMDINRLPDGSLVLAHDESRFARAVPPQAVFAALHHPEQKTYWMDLKVPLTQADIDALLQAAAAFDIPRERFFFETKGGETARLLAQNGLSVLLQITDGFNEDGGDPARRAALNQELAAELETYRPAAVAASFGKYPYLRAYFPNVNKAIYTATTKRPSLKKYFLTREMQKDPSVKIFMLDEYTAVPF